MATMAVAALSPTAHADAPPLTAAQQQGLADAMSYFQMVLLGGYDVASPAAPTVEADHYRLQAPLHFGASRKPIGTVTVLAKSLDAGRWALDGAPFSATNSNLTAPPSTGNGIQKLAIGLQGLTSHSVVDPSLATGSSFDSVEDGAAFDFSAPKVPATAVTIGKITSHVSWQPAGSRRVDTTTSGDVDNVVVDTLGAVGLHLSIRHVTVQDVQHGFAPLKQLEAKRILEQVEPAEPAVAGATQPLSVVQRAALHHGIDLLRDVYGSGEMALGAEGIVGKIALAKGRELALDKFAYGAAFSQPDGKVDIKVRIALDRFTLVAGAPSLPLPRHIVVALHFAGPPVSELFDAVGKESDTGSIRPASLTVAFMAALATMPLATTLDELSFGLGPSSWTASGALRSDGSKNIAGEGVVRVTGLDALIQAVTAGAGGPRMSAGLIFLKGLGQQEGDAVIWKVARVGNKTTVNGTDVANLFPHHA